MSMRRITQQDALKLDWTHAVLCQKTEPCHARPALDGEPMPNGEQAATGDMVMTTPQGDALYKMDLDDFKAHWQASIVPNFYTPKADPRPVLLLDAPFHLDAPHAWAQDGHGGWDVTEKITIGGREGFPVIKRGDDVMFDRPLTRGGYEPVQG